MEEVYYCYATYYLHSGGEIETGLSTVEAVEREIKENKNIKSVSWDVDTRIEELNKRHQSA